MANSDVQEKTDENGVATFDIFDLSDILFDYMIHVLDNVLETENWNKVAEGFGRMLAGSDDELILAAFLRFMESGGFGRAVFDKTADSLSDATFERLVSFVESNRASDESERFGPLLDRVMDTGKGRRLKARAQKKDIDEKVREIREFAQFQSEIAAIVHTGELTEKNIKVLHALPETVEKLLAEKKIQAAEVIIEKLGDALLESGPEIRTEVSGVLLVIGENLISARKLEIMRKNVGKLVEWIKLETDLTPEYEKICIQLQNLAQTLIRMRKFSECAPILKTFHVIHAKILEKEDPFTFFAGKILKGIASTNVLKPLLREFQSNEKNKRKKAAECLAYLGENSARMLLELLRESQDRNERSRILKVVSNIGRSALPALTEQMHRAETWYYIRNLILLFGRVGSEFHTDFLKQFLTYPDIRVQRETLYAINKIGGKNRGEVLLSALLSADDRLKQQIVVMLGDLEYTDAVPYLLQLLETETTLTAEAGEELAEKMINSLGVIGSMEAVPTLEAITNGKGPIDGKEPGPKLVAAAEDALEMINDRDNVLNQTVTLKIKRSVGKNGDTTVEIIDEREAAALEDEQTIWPELYESLDPDEADILFHAMERIEVREEDLVFKQGETNSKLYFVERGEIVIAYDQGQVISPFGETDEVDIEDEEVWVKTLHPGSVAGCESFFSNSISTVSLRALTDARLRYLDNIVLEDWKNSFPLIESKLRAYCDRFKKVSEILEEYGMERRFDRRLEISGKLVVQFLDAGKNPKGKPVGGSFADISIGGASFRIKAPGITDPVTILGKNLKIRTCIFNDRLEETIEQAGRVVGAKCADHNQIYLIHMKFDRILMRIVDFFSDEGTAKAKIPETTKRPPRDFLKTQIKF